jgi:hypothetical protein
MKSKKKSSNSKRRANMFPSSKKNRDNLKLLFSDQTFQKRVKDVRKHLLLPIEGIDSKGEDGDQRGKEWFDDMCKRSEEVSFSKEFHFQLKIFHDKFMNKEISYSEHEKLKYDLHKQIPINYLARMSKDLAVEFNVPLHYKQAIYQYIIYSNPGFHVPATPFTEMRGTSENFHEKCISLTFYSKITDKDLKLIKQRVNGSFSIHQLPEINPLQDLETKLAIEEYYRNRDVYNESDQESYRLTAKEIVENIEADTGKKIKADVVYEVIRELSNLREKRFGKK